MEKSELITKVLVPVLAAAVSGIGVVVITPDWEEQARNKGWAPKSEWSETARRDDWIPMNECPAYPISMEIFAPGEGATLDHINSLERETSIYHDILVRLNRPITENSDIGFIYHVAESSDYFINFPYLDKRNNGTILANTNLFTVPTHIKPRDKLSIWAFIAKKDSLVASRFSSLEQIKKLQEITYVSNPTTVVIEPK